MADIREMEAGRELDAQVAVQVMRLPVIKLEDARCPYCNDETRFCGTRSWCSNHEWIYSPYKEYSSDIAAAWDVVEQLETLHLKHAGEHGVWEAYFCGHHESRAHGGTAPLAICLAALLTVAAPVDAAGDVELG